jgi:hypothetical protein
MPHDTLLGRIRAEYLEMPGLQLTLAQAQRLWGLERELCKAVLDALVAEDFLRARGDGRYMRHADTPVARSRPAKADLGPDRRVARAS